MNILHLEDEPWDSGIAHYALTLAAEQARRGHRVEFWGRVDSPVLDEARRLGLRVRGWQGGAAGLLTWPRQRAVAGEFQPRVINAHTGASHSLALALAFNRPCAVVRTRGDARAPRATALTRFAASRTDAFIAANAALAKALKAAFPAAKVARVEQGIDGPPHPTFLPPGPLVGMIARFDKVKGHETLLDAAALLKAKVPGLKVRCAGEGRLRERLSWQLKPTGLDRVVEFPGRVADKWAFMAAARVGAIPSLGSEAVSRAALEWMALGRPVVASAVGGLPDLVEDGVTGILVPPKDADALAEALASLLLDPKKTEAMGRAARTRWEQRYGLKRFCDETQTVYNEATAHLPL
ncbi:MAG: glycosyltransferase family 4 protein [Elusimicrobiota bacterium]|nr:MAG: glycosyltransferase family 4 protein [Elusimicrobiota bacterium]